MKILYLDIKTFFANRDMLDALERYIDDTGKHIVVVKYKYDYDESKVRNDDEFEKRFLETLRCESPDFVFSFNFLPVVSKVCKIDGVKYVSWIYDNPLVYLYSCQVINPCNIVLMFDSKEYSKFVDGGIKTVEYLPLAASVRRLDEVRPTKQQIEMYSADVSFVGSLYTERKQYYDEIAPKKQPKRE